MIILICGLCGCKNLRKSGFYMQFVCDGCGRTIELFQTQTLEEKNPDPPKESTSDEPNKPLPTK